MKALICSSYLFCSDLFSICTIFHFHFIGTIDIDDTQNQLSLLLYRVFSILCLWDFSTKLTSSKFLIVWTIVMSLPMLKFMVPLPCVCCWLVCCAFVACCCNGGGVVSGLVLMPLLGGACWFCVTVCCWGGCCDLVGLPVLLCVGDEGWLICGDDDWGGYCGWV